MFISPGCKPAEVSVDFAGFKTQLYLDSAYNGRAGSWCEGRRQPQSKLAKVYLEERDRVTGHKYGKSAGSRRHRRSVMAIILFDLDGTLIDVSGSYDFAVTQTVRLYCERVAGLNVEGELVTYNELAALRAAGGFNNDWDLAAGLTIWALDQSGDRGIGATIDGGVYKDLPSVIDRIRASGGGLVGMAECVEPASVRQVGHGGSTVDTSLIVRIFQGVYLGEQFRAVYGLPSEYWDGPAACRRERPLVSGEVLAELGRRGAQGVVTGRPKLEAKLAVSMLSEWLSPRVVVSDDDLVDSSGRHRPDWRKPAGEPLRMALEQIAGPDGEVAIYLGDLPDDVVAVQNASRLTGRRIYSIGCAYGAADPKARAELLRSVGADRVVLRPEELPAVVDDLPA